MNKKVITFLSLFKTCFKTVSLPEPDGPDKINNLPLFIVIFLGFFGVFIAHSVANRFGLQVG